MSGLPRCATNPILRPPAVVKTNPTACSRAERRGPSGKFENTNPTAGLCPLLRNEPNLAVADGFVKTNPTARSRAQGEGHWAALKIRTQCLDSARKVRNARSSIVNLFGPAGPSLRTKMGGPRDATGAPGRPVTLGFQTTVGRRFEHLAAKKNRRLSRKVFLRQELAGLHRSGGRGRDTTAESYLKIAFGGVV